MSVPGGRRPAWLWTSVGVVVAAVAVALLWLRSGAGYSNIYPEDYVGPDACRECHEQNHDDNYDAWSNHAHRVMNQNASDESVLGDFSDTELRYGRGHALFHRDGPDFMISIFEGGELVRRHRVTRTVGSLYVQYYIGTQVEGPEPASHISYRTENKLPFGYSVALDRWLPEIYFDSTVAPEAAYLDGRRPDYIYDEPPHHTWNVSCLTCHNTYPYVARLWTQRKPSSWSGGFPLDAVTWEGLESEHGGQLRLPGNVQGLQGEELVTVGISCESCHFGGREHALEEREIRFVPTAADLTIQHPLHGKPAESDRDDPFVINSICRQCHNAQLTRYPDGSSAVNSDEANALTAGACRSAIKCTDCHNPHEAGSPSGSPDESGYAEACLGCHPQLEPQAARARHTRHSEAVSCLDCHMPRIVSGLDTIVRSHRISLPTDLRMVRTRGPNACNLCHLDRPITWTLDELAAGWGLPRPRTDQVEAWYGANATTPIGTLWGDSRSPFIRMTAVEAYARSPRVDGRIEGMLGGLLDRKAFNRTLALITLERVIGQQLPPEDYDLLASPDRRREQVAELSEVLRDAL